MQLTVLRVKLVHTAIFALLSACVLYVLASGVVDRITPWTWLAMAAIVVEGIVLLANGGKCPLTAVTERLGAVDGGVSDIFLPRWFADRIFPICGTLFAAGCVLVAARILLPAGPTAMAIDVAPLWDFADPQASEQRLRAALATAHGDDALILQTQIARSYGLRKDFGSARATLAGIEPKIATAGAEARARFALESGRTIASAAHAPESQTDAARALARARYETALATAREAKLDGLAVDAIHMLAFVDTAPADQLKWAQAALAVVEASDQPAAKRWEGSIRNNLGYALHQLGRFDEALAQFRQALAIRERGTDGKATRTAHWMIAWTLRAMKRTDEALAIQVRLEREGDQANQPDPHVFAELEILYREKGDRARSAHYASRREAASK